MAPRTHQFSAIAFEENFSLKQLASHFQQARLTTHELCLTFPPEGSLYIYLFGAVVTHDLPPEVRDDQLAILHRALPKLTTQVVREDYSVVEDERTELGIVDGTLHIDRLTPARAGIVAFIVGQSAAMEYYERITDELFARITTIVEQLERRGAVPFRMRPLNRFIGEALATRNEVLSVLHLLDKPDEAWDDPAMDRIYDDLRAEFDLVDRYAALELKLRSIQETLELVLGVARDRILLILEVVVVILILTEILLSVSRILQP